MSDIDEVTPVIDHTRIGVESRVASHTCEPEVVLTWGAEKGVFSVRQARQHALIIMEAVSAAETDALIVKTMLRKLGADIVTTTKMLHAMRDFRDDPDSSEPIDLAAMQAQQKVSE